MLVPSSNSRSCYARTSYDHGASLTLVINFVPTKCPLPACPDNVCPISGTMYSRRLHVRGQSKIESVVCSRRPGWSRLVGSTLMITGEKCHDRKSWCTRASWMLSEQRVMALNTLRSACIDAGFSHNLDWLQSCIVHTN